jgi:uncharacterized protein (TIGR03435 family)
MRVVSAVAVAWLLSVELLGQSSAPGQASLSFEVASVRPVDSTTRYGIGPPVNGLVRARAIEVRRLVQYAYGIDPNGQHPRPEGGASWIDNDLFEINAKGPSDLTFADARRMMLALLRDRFQLKSRLVQRETPVYTLVPARKDGVLGPSLRPSSTDCGAYSDTLDRTGRLAAAREVSTNCELLGGGGIGGGRLQLRGTGTIRDMLRVIVRSPDVDRPVVDRTGLIGTYDVDFVWSPARVGPGAAPPQDVVSIFTALQEQLGLKLQPARELLDVVVIDSVERPAAN